MKPIFTRLLCLKEKLTNLVLSKANNARRAVLRSEARERTEMEAERLDRLRNPQDYRGR